MAETIGKAYVQILPSTEGLGVSLNNAMDTAGKTAGDKGGASAGASFAKKMIGAIAAAGLTKKFGDIVKSAVEAGGALEQSIGGIEALYGAGSDAANQLIKDANEAYKTVGISANQYMENVTSFSAALLNGLGGDTEKAAKIANQAMIDMGDNVNRFGTDMESVQNAIMGLSRGNFTMLDNLKLGFAGNQQGMIDLINASGILGKNIESLDGITFDQMLSAIHEVQTQLNVSGTTAKEAATTFEGSLNAMKSAWENLKAATATGGDVGGAVQAMSETFTTFMQNLIPMIGNVLKTLPGALSSIFGTIAQNFDLTAFTDAIIAKLEQLPDLIAKFAEWLQAKADGEGDSKFGAAAGAIILALGKAVIASLPALLSAVEAAFQMLIEFLGTALAGLLSAFDDWVNTKVLPEGKAFVDRIKEGIAAKWSEILNAGRDLVQKVIDGVKQRFANLQANGREIITNIKNGLLAAVAGMATIGMDIVRGIWSGISGGLSWIKNMISGWIGNVKDFIKSLFGISSPSKWGRDVIGAMIPEGIAIGIEDNTGVIDEAMQGLRLSAYDSMNVPDMVNNFSYAGEAATAAQAGGINITIYGADHQDEMAIARYVERVIAENVKRKGLAYA